MPVDKPKEAPGKKTMLEKVVDAKPESSAETENKPDSSSRTESKSDAPASKQSMGEGQKAVSKAYKDNWNEIFAKKKKR